MTGVVSSQEAFGKCFCVRIRAGCDQRRREKFLGCRIPTQNRHGSNRQADRSFYLIERIPPSLARRSESGRGVGFSRFPWLAGDEGESQWQSPDSAPSNSLCSAGCAGGSVLPPLRFDCQSARLPFSRLTCSRLARFGRLRFKVESFANPARSARSAFRLPIRE
jgi:hypothetical protein